MPHLNFSTRGLSSYPLPLTALLNSYTNSSIVLLPCSSLFNSATFTPFSSHPPNSFLIFANNSPTVSCSSEPFSKSFNVFSFYISANPPYTYDNIHWICSCTAALLIFIHKYNLHTITNSKTFAEVLLNMCSLATSMLVPSPPTPTS